MVASLPMLTKLLPHKPGDQAALVAPLPLTLHHLTATYL